MGDDQGTESSDMLTQSECCELKRQLLQNLLQVLSRVSHISMTQAEVSRQDAANEQSRLDDMLRRAVSEQREAVRRLEDHQQEHGC
jgi:hypothetical protein